jgi:hypothetical protein
MLCCCGTGWKDVYYEDREPVKRLERPSRRRRRLEKGFPGENQSGLFLFFIILPIHNPVLLSSKTDSPPLLLPLVDAACIGTSTPCPFLPRSVRFRASGRSAPPGVRGRATGPRLATPRVVVVVAISSIGTRTSRRCCYHRSLSTGSSERCRWSRSRCAGHGHGHGPRSPMDSLRCRHHKNMKARCLVLSKSGRKAHHLVCAGRSSGVKKVFVQSLPLVVVSSSPVAARA